MSKDLIELWLKEHRSKFRKMASDVRDQAEVSKTDSWIDTMEFMAETYDEVLAVLERRLAQLSQPEKGVG